MGEFLQELSWHSRKSNVLIDEGTMFWRQGNQLSKPMEVEEDSVLLIMLWDKADETTAYWSVATTQGTQEGKRQERPVITIDTDTEATGEQSDKGGFVVPKELHFDLNQGEPDMNRYWTAEEDLPDNMSCARKRRQMKQWSEEASTCKDRKRCLLCQSKHLSIGAGQEDVCFDSQSIGVLVQARKVA